MRGKIPRSNAPAQLNFAFTQLDVAIVAPDCLLSLGRRGDYGGRMERAGAPRHRLQNPRGQGKRAGSERIKPFGAPAAAHSMFDVERWAFPSIQRTSHTQPRLIQDVGINHGCRDIFTP